MSSTTVISIISPFTDRYKKQRHSRYTQSLVQKILRKWFRGHFLNNFLQKLTQYIKALVSEN